MGKNDYAIVVGVRYPGLYPLNATLTDAIKFAEWLKSPEGGDLPRENCTAILSEPELSSPAVVPTRREFHNALETILAGRDTPGRRLYFYFAGHGFSHGFNEVAMLMADATLDSLNRNIGLERLLGLFKDRLFFREIVCILDCCRDSSPRNRAVEIPPLDFTFRRSSILPDVDLFVVLASEYGRKAFEPLIGKAKEGQAEERRGLLTAALLDCLDDDRLADRDTTSASLETPLRVRMKALAAKIEDKRARSRAQRQEPQVIYHPNPGPMILSKRPKRVTPPAAMPAADGLEMDVAPPVDDGATRQAETVQMRVIAPAKLAGDLVVYDNDMQPIDRRRAADATARKPAWTVPLMPNRRYAVGRAADDAVPRIIEDVRQLPKAKDHGYVYHFPASG